MIHEIIEQMLSVKAGQKIFVRLEELCNGEVTPQRISALSDDEVRGTETSSSKVKCIRNLTDSIIARKIDLDSFTSMSDADVAKTLIDLHGIGMWTEKLYLMFVLDRPDILPVEDGAFLQTYRWLYKTNDCSPQAITKRCRKWKPYTTTASRFFYRALDMGLTKTDFRLYR